MLDKFRKATQTIYVKILIVLIIASFAFWGIGGMIRSSVTDFAIKVGDFKVSRAMYQNEVSKTNNFYRNYYGESLTEEMLNTIPFGEITASRLIRHYLLLQEAKDLNIAVPDDAVFAQIFANPNYLTDDKFDKSKFDDFLAKNGISETYYVNYIQEYTSVNLIQSLFQTYNNSYDEVSDLVSSYYNQEKLADIYKINVASLINMEFPISESELIEYHNKNSSNFIKAESRSIQYIDLSCKNLEQFVTLSESEIQTEYEDRSTEFSVAELREIKQLFFDDEESANSALADIAQGSSLGDIATKYKIDDAVINIGEVSKDQVIGDFAKAIFSASQGNFSAIVKGPIGYHIFYIKTITPGQKKPLSLVRDQIVAGLTKQKSCSQAYELFNTVEDEISAGHNLEEIAYNHQLVVQSNENLAKDSEVFGTLALNYADIGSSVMQEFFASANKMKNVSKVVGSDVFIVYNVDKIIPERTKTLDEVKGIVTNLIKEDQQKQALVKLARNTHKSLVNKEDVANANTQYQLMRDQKINRHSVDYTMEVIEQVLAAGVGTVLMPIYDTKGESYLVIDVKGKSAKKQFSLPQAKPAQ